jgi:hypothetical protein
MPLNKLRKTLPLPASDPPGGCSDLAITAGGTRLAAMRKRVPVLLTLLAIGLGLAACGARHTEVYLWPPAADVADP